MIMTANRKGRDEVAEIYLKFLRGHVTTLGLPYQFGVVAASLHGNRDSDLYLCFLFSEGIRGFRKKMFEEEWNSFLRRFAYLKSDLDFESVEIPPGDSWSAADEKALVRTCRGHAFCLATAFAIAFFCGWWIFFTTWMASFLLFVTVMPGLRFQISNGNDSTGDGEFFPFATEDEWLRHQPLLEKYDLSSLKPKRPGPLAGVFRQSSMRVIAFWAEKKPYIVLIVYYVVFFLLWPVCAASACFYRINARPQMFDNFGSHVQGAVMTVVQILFGIAVHLLAFPGEMISLDSLFASFIGGILITWFLASLWSRVLG